MRFFDDIQTKAYGSRIEAGHLLGLISNASFTEYSSFDAHCKSIIPPFARTWQLLRNSARILYSSYVFVGALFSGNRVGMACAVSNIGFLIHASFLEVLNMACSIISIATRTLASILNGGYTPDPISHTIPELIDTLGEDIVNDMSGSEISPHLETIEVRSPKTPLLLTPEKIDTKIYSKATAFI